MDGQALDITFAVPDGATIDAASVAGFTGVVLGGGGLGSVAFDHDYAPQVLADGKTVAYRIKGSFVSGDVTVAVGPGSFTYSTVPVSGSSTPTDANTSSPVVVGTVVDGVAPFASVGADGFTTIDVTFPAGTLSTGYAIDPSSLDGTEISLGGAGLGTAAIDPTVAPQVVGNGFVVRYRITGAFAQNGVVTATLTPASWSLVPATALQESTLSAPVTVVRHSSIDVALTPTIGGTIDYSHLVLSSTDLVITGPTVGSGVGTVTVDSQTPIWLGGNRFRFFLDGAFVPGEVDLSFAAGAFSDSNGYSNAAASFSVTVLGPTGALVDPASNATVGANGMNGEGYIDIPFTVPSGSSLDPTTMSNLAGTFTLSGATGFSIDTTQAPVLVLHADGSHTWVYRFWTTGAYTSGTVQVVFNPGTFTGPVAPANFIVDGVATPNIHHLDVQLTPTAGNTIDLASINDTAPELALSGPGAGSLTLVADAAPTQLPGTTSTYRYYVSGSFAPGKVEVDFIASSFTSGGFANLGKSDSFTVQQLTAALADPGSGAMTGVQTINGQSFVDVTYTLPAYATGLDVSSVTDLTDEFTIAPVSSSAGTIALDDTQAPVLDLAERLELHVPLLDDRDDAERQRAAHVHRRQRLVHGRARPVDAAVRAGAGHRPGLDRPPVHRRSVRHDELARREQHQRRRVHDLRRHRLRAGSGQRPAGDVPVHDHRIGPRVRPAGDADLRRRALDVHRPGERPAGGRPAHAHRRHVHRRPVRVVVDRAARPRLDHRLGAGADPRRQRRHGAPRRVAGADDPRRRPRPLLRLGPVRAGHRQRLLHRRLVAGHRGRPGSRRLGHRSSSSTRSRTRAPARPRSACSSSRCRAA